MSSYHMPNERDYQFIPTSVVTTFGVDSSIGKYPFYLRLDILDQEN